MENLNKENIDKLSDSKKEKIIEIMNKRLDYAVNFWSEQRELAEKDVDFFNGLQWDADDVNERNERGCPSLVFNKIASPIKKIINDFKQHRPQANYGMGDSTRDPRIAALMNSLIHKIQVDSEASRIYDKCYSNLVKTGESYFRACVRQAKGVSFYREIYLLPIDNIHQVFIDPNGVNDPKLTKYAFVMSKMSSDEYSKRFNKDPEDACRSLKGFGGIDIDKDEIPLMEYFYINEEKDDVYEVDDGDFFIRKREYDKLKKQPKIKRKITKTFIEVKHIISDGEDVLEQVTFPGEYIPVYASFGEITDLKDGRKAFKSAIRDAISPQISYNVQISTLQWQIDAIPKARFFTGKGQVTGKAKNEMLRSNGKNVNFIEISRFDDMGTDMGFPQKIDDSVNIDGVLTSLQIAEREIQNAIGVFDTTLGADNGSTQQESGKARWIKQTQSETNNFYMVDSFSQTLEFFAKSMVPAIKEIYNDERRYNVSLKGGLEKKEISPADSDIDFSYDDFEIVAEVGAYGETQRKSSLEVKLGLVQANPELMNIIGDLIIEDSGLSNSDEIIKRMISSGFISAEALAGSNDDTLKQLADLKQSLTQMQAESQSKDLQIQELSATLDQSKLDMASLVSELGETKNKLNEERTLRRSNEEKTRIDNITKLVMKLVDTDPRYIVYALSLYDVQLPMLDAEKKPVDEMQNQVVVAGINDPLTTQQQNELNNPNNEVEDVNSDEQSEDNQQVDDIDELINNMPTEEE